MGQSIDADTLPAGRPDRPRDAPRDGRRDGPSETVHVVATGGAGVPAGLRRLITGAAPAVTLRELPSVAAAVAPEAPRSGPVVLLHVAPAVAMARALAAGQVPSAALAAWMADAEALLAACRRMRRRATLLDWQQAATAAAPLAEALGRRLGLTLPPAPDGDTQAPDDGEAAADDPLLVLLAEAMLARDAQAMQLAAELEAMTLALPGQPAAAPDLPDLGFARLAARADETAALDRQVAQLTARLAEGEALAAGHEARATERAAAAEAATRRIAALDRQVAQLTARVAEREALAAGHEARATERAAAAEAATRRIADLEAALAEAQGLMRQVAAATDEAARLRARLAALQSAADGRAGVEAGLREDLAQLARNEAVLASQTLRFAALADGLEDDLGPARAALEAANAETARLGAALEAAEAEVGRLGAALEAERQAHEAARTAAAAEHERLHAALETERQGHAQARHELEAVYASRSWRVTGPMRAVGRTIRSGG